MTASNLSLRKRIFFGFVPAIFVVLFLILLEFVLRLATPSLGNPFVTQVTIAGQDWYRINRRYLEKYFPEEREAVVPELRPVLFRKIKGGNTVRIFCLGESSMFGTPYEMNANIPAIVRKQLRHLYPGKDFEVVNLGASAINSNVIADIAGMLPQYEPDLVLIYLGHNEFYGPDGVGASWLQRTFPSTIPLVYSLRDLRIFKLLQRFTRTAEGTHPDDHRNLMETVSRNTLVPLASPAAGRVFRLFRENLTGIVEVFQRHNIPVIVSDVTSNLNFPPFVSDTLNTVVDWPKFRTFVQAAFAHRLYPLLVDTLTHALAPDSGNAFVNFWLGKSYEALANPDLALPCLTAARDHDLLKFRAPREINAIIRDVTAHTGVPFISSDSLFASITRGGIPDTNLFWEHLHPNARGYYEIANLFVTKIAGLHPSWAPSGNRTASRLLPWNTDSLSICWLDLAFADISMRNLTTHPPFTDYRSPAVVMEQASPELQQIAWNVYTYKLGWTDGCLQTALQFQRTRRERDAETTYEALIEDFPDDFYAHYMLAVLMKQTGRLRAAESQYARAIALNPSYPYPRIDLALLLINDGEQDSAIVLLQSALLTLGEKNFPTEKASIYYGLAAAYANKGELETGLRYADTSLSFVPMYAAARALSEQLRRHLGN